MQMNNIIKQEIEAQRAKNEVSFLQNQHFLTERAAQAKGRTGRPGTIDAA